MEEFGARRLAFSSEQSEGEGLELFKDLGTELPHLYNIDHARHFHALNSNAKAEAEQTSGF